MNSNLVARARSLLFVPGHRPDRFEKAARSGADAVVLDLEDAVPLADKAKARASIEEQWERLRDCGVPILIRINAGETGRQDIAWLKRLSAPAAIVLPKAESAESIVSVHQALGGVALVPIIESAAGYAGLSAVAAAPGVLRLAIGHLDFLADTGMQCDDEQSELAPLRFAVAVATRVNKLAPGIDGVTQQIGDEQRLRIDVKRALRFGLGGKLCIHPTQVAIVHDAMTPTEEELQWARKVVEADAAANGAAVQLDGRMVDLPVVLRARRLLGLKT